jgi:hypothetical protein
MKKDSILEVLEKTQQTVTKIKATLEVLEEDLQKSDLAKMNGNYPPPLPAPSQPTSVRPPLAMSEDKKKEVLKFAKNGQWKLEEMEKAVVPGMTWGDVKNKAKGAGKAAALAGVMGAGLAGSTPTHEAADFPLLVGGPSQSQQQVQAPEQAPPGGYPADVHLEFKDGMDVLAPSKPVAARPAPTVSASARGGSIKMAPQGGQKPFKLSPAAQAVLARQKSMENQAAQRPSSAPASPGFEQRVAARMKEMNQQRALQRAASAGDKRVQAQIAREQSMLKEEDSKSESGQKKVHTVMKEFKEGKLHSGSGAEVKNRDQAVAIALKQAGKSKA